MTAGRTADWENFENEVYQSVREHVESGMSIVNLEVQAHKAFVVL